MGECFDLTKALRDSSWTELPNAIQRAAEWLETEPIGTEGSQLVVVELINLVSHEKWEVRRALALAAGTCRHGALDDALSRLSADNNARVQHAAETSSLRRRDWRAAGLLGREHEQRVNTLLDDVQYRCGAQGRVAVRRAATEMVNTFTRELYHEVIKHITPLDREVQRLKKSIASARGQEVVAAHASHLERDLSQLKAVLEATRLYAATPDLVFATEPLRDVVNQAVRTTSTIADSLGVVIENKVEATVVASIARARFVQALSNLIYNGVEAYIGMTERNPIVIDVAETDATILVRIRDRGCGMSTQTQADSRALFSTNKRNGTGVGLPLAIKIVESEHDGRLDIDSAENQGTTISITLPRYREPR
jgi:nitrogen fixation/metabolism regulation signal transduction histidine kinase